jgi:endonuclease III
MKEKTKELVLKIGRMIGFSKRKNKDIVEMWQEMLNAQGVNPADRMLELMAWDLQNAGINLRM